MLKFSLFFIPENWKNNGKPKKMYGKPKKIIVNINWGVLVFFSLSATTSSKEAYTRESSKCIVTSSYLAMEQTAAAPAADNQLLSARSENKITNNQILSSQVQKKILIYKAPATTWLGRTNTPQLIYQAFQCVFISSQIQNSAKSPAVKMLNNWASGWYIPGRKSAVAS